MKLLSELCNKLNGSLKDFEKYKIYNHSDFHEKVKEIVKPLLPQDFTVATWGINYKRIGRVLSYNRDFNPYKINGRKRQGVFRNVRFEIAIETHETLSNHSKKYSNDIEIYEIEDFINGKNKTYEIECLNYEILKKTNELEELKTKLKELL